MCDAAEILSPTEAHRLGEALVRQIECQDCRASKLQSQPSYDLVKTIQVKRKYMSIDFVS